VETACHLGYKPKNDYLIYVDEQPCNRHNFDALMKSLSKTFNVSLQAVEYHIKSFSRIIRDDRKIKVSHSFVIESLKNIKNIS
jgi:hypothetical protein